MNVEELLKRDPATITDEEAEFLANESQLHFSFEKSIKLILNSIYGAFANEFFHFYNVNIAETITMQGQDAIKFTEVVANKYFNEFFHKDRELLSALGVPDGQEVDPIVKPPVLYCDTDSSYITFQDAIRSVGWKGSTKDFILTFDKVRLRGYFKRVLDKYAKDRNVENYLDFELETISCWRRCNL